MWRKNFAWKISSLFLGGGLAFLFQIAAMRYLGPRDYGYWSLAIGWAGLFAVLVDYGFNPLLSRDLARQPEQARSYLATVLKGKLFFAVTAGFILIITWRYYPAVQLSGRLLLIAFIYLCCASTAESLQAITYALERFPLGAFLSIVQKALPAIVGFIFIYFRAALYPLFAHFTSASLCMVILGCMYVYWSVPSTKGSIASRFQPLMKAGLPMFLQNLFILIYFRVDTLMIGHYTTPVQAGLYGAAYRFFELSNVIPTALMAAWIAPLSKDLEINQSGALFYAALKVFAAFAVGGVLFLEALAWLSPYALGHAYVQVRAVLMCLSFTILFYFPNFLLSTVLVLKGRPGWNTLFAGLCAVFNVLVNMWAIPRWGAMAAAWTTLATEGILFGLSLAITLHFLHQPLPASEA